MRSDTNAQRLTCPRCRANNFVGQAQCWQCGGSLPPPEALGPPTAMNQAYPTPPMPPMRMPQEIAAGQAPAAYGGRRGRSKRPLIMAGALLTAGCGVLWAFHRPAAAPSTPYALPPGVSTAGTEGVLPDGVLPGTGNVRLAQPGRDEIPLSSDPNEAAARRAIQRSIPRLGLPPGVGDDGSVHLRNGDTISREQYEEVQRKLKNNPILGGPPSIPRL